MQAYMVSDVHNEKSNEPGMCCVLVDIEKTSPHIRVPDVQYHGQYSCDLAR